ncbi:hypothetical protein L1049_005270 [Liquidambar formosana]|uniref:Glycosyltransferase n=1 Tax=Liquidambar formosana TaxID=63359 RepID=A0AAP0X1B9_LIQFO
MEEESSRLHRSHLLMASAHTQSHVVIFPFMAQGHTFPLIDLSKALAFRGLKVTIITTPSNASSLFPKISTYPQISLSIIPFPRVAELPEGCENTANLPSMDLWVSFAKATENLQQPFEAVLKDMSKAGCLPICVISDFFLGWTLDTCRSFGIPRIVFHGMGVLPMLLSKTSFSHIPCIMASSYSDPIPFPEVKIPFTLNRTDFPDLPRWIDPTDPFSRAVWEAGEGDVNSWGVIVNSFEELEGDYVAGLESFYITKGAKAWCVGPVLLYDQIQQETLVSDRSHNGNQSDPYIKWLDEIGESGRLVMYVSFGTQAHISDAQMDEIAHGLEMAGEPFIWVIKSITWVPPDRWEERVKERGLIVKDWVEQRCILAHPAIGGFLRHCGWNSVLESLSNGVPLLAWPIGNDQPLNAKFVVDGLGAGVWVPQTSVGREEIVTVGCGLICDGVKELMGGLQGKKARETAQILRTKSRRAVEKGGSSDKKLDELIECLTRRQKENTEDIL